MGSGVAIGIWTALSAAAGSGTGAVAGVVASPIGAIESFGDAWGVGDGGVGNDGKVRGGRQSFLHRHGNSVS